MASHPPGHVYRGVPEPTVELPRPEIPKSPMPWFIVLLAVFAVATIAGVLVGFWRAANPERPVPGLERRGTESPAVPPGP